MSSRDTQYPRCRCQHALSAWAFLPAQTNDQRRRSLPKRRAGETEHRPGRRQRDLPELGGDHGAASILRENRGLIVLCLNCACSCVMYKTCVCMCTRAPVCAYSTAETRRPRLDRLHAPREPRTFARVCGSLGAGRPRTLRGSGVKKTISGGSHRAPQGAGPLSRQPRQHRRGPEAHGDAGNRLGVGDMHTHTHTHAHTCARTRTHERFIHDTRTCGSDTTQLAHDLYTIQTQTHIFLTKQNQYTM